MNTASTPPPSPNSFNQPSEPASAIPPWASSTPATDNPSPAPANPFGQPTMPQNPIPAVEPPASPSPFPQAQTATPDPGESRMSDITETPNPSAPTGLPETPPQAQETTVMQSSPVSPQVDPLAPPSQSAPANSLPNLGPVDTAPTDLSHLVGSGEQTPSDVYTPSMGIPENQPGGTPPSPPHSQEGTASAGNTKHFSMGKLFIIVGGIILLIVTGASAYFFFNSQQTPEETASVPAVQEQAPLTNPPQLLTAPSASASATPAFPNASGGASSFGALNGASASASPTSAIDRLRSGSSASPSATTN